MPILIQLSHTIFVIASFLSILSGYQYFKYRTPMASWGGALLLCLAIELLSFSIQLVASSVVLNFWLYTIEIISFYFLTILWLLFIFEISGFSNRLDLRFIFLIFCLPAVVLTSLLSSAQGQFSKIQGTQVIGSFGQLSVLIGPYGSFLSILLLSIGITAIIFLFKLFLSPNRYYQKLTLPMLLGTIFILLLSSLDGSGVNPFRPVNLTQMGLVVISIFYFYMAVVWRFGGILPISRESVFEGMNDAVLILDYYNKVIDVNQPAQKIIGVDKKNIINQKLSTIWPLGASLMDDNTAGTQTEKEIELLVEGEEFVFNMLVTHFIGLNNVPTGSLVLLRNVTSRERMEKALNQKAQELQRANAFLSALAKVNMTLQSALNSSQINVTLGAELKKMGLACFIAKLDPVSNELFVSYISNQSEVLRQIEKLLGKKVIGYRLGRDQFPNLYKILDSKKITFRPFHPDDLVDSPGKLSAILLEQAVRLIGFEPDMAALVLPLATGGYDLGMLGVWGSTLRESDISPFQVFANQVALVMERALLYETEIQRSSELARTNNLVIALSKVASVLGTTSNSELVLDTLGKELQHTGLNCAVVTLDEACEMAYLKYLSFSPELIQQVEKITGLQTKNLAIPRQFWPGTRIITQQSPIWYPKPGEYFRKLFPQISQSASKHGLKLFNFKEDDQICILPLNNGNRPIGGLVIWGPKLKPTDGPILSVFGSQVAGIIENLANYENERRRTGELERTNAMVMALSKVAAQLDTTTELPRVFETLGNELEKKVQVNCMVGTLDDLKQVMKVEYLSISPDVIRWAEKLGVFWPNDLAIPRRLWPTDKAVTERVPYWDPDPIGSSNKMLPFIPRQIFEKTFEMAGMNLNDQVCYLPMISEEDVIGILAVWGYDLRHEDIPGLSVFANQVATAIRNTRLYDQAQQEIVQRTQAEAHTRETLHEKEVLLREVHHRVKNNLQVISSLLNLQAGQVSDPTTVNVLRESQNRVRSMALIHEKLYQSNDLARIDFAGYLQSLVTSLAQTYRTNSEKVAIRVQSEKIVLNIDTAIPCGLIVNELVSNSLKYAFPGEAAGTIEVSCQQGVDGCCILVVQDDGVGLPEGLDVRRSQSLGLKLVISLVRQIDGEMVIDGKEGARFEIKFLKR